MIHSDEEYLVVTRKLCIFALYNVNKHSMLRQKREKSGTGICHVMQGKESKTVPYMVVGYHNSPELQVSPFRRICNSPAMNIRICNSIR